MESGRDVPRLDPFEDLICLGDPYPVYRRLRDAAPVYYNQERDFWALSRYDDVVAALQDDEHLSLQGPTGNVIWEIPGLSIATQDDPRHAQLRNLISRGFTPRRIEHLEPLIQTRARETLERISAAGRSDFIAAFAAQLPSDTVCALVGVPESDASYVKSLVHALADVALEPTQEQAWSLLFEYFARLRRDKRRSPGSDLISALLDAEIDGERLRPEELDEFFVLMGQAGQETMQAFFGTALYWLEAHPEQRRLLARRPEGIPDAVEEILRIDAPTQWMNRTLVSPIQLHGATIPCGARLILLFGSANRDERRFPEPDRFDVTRRPSGMLSFGYGAHFCLGASLARLMARLALTELLTRFPNYVLHHDGAERLRSQGSVMRGFRKLPITLSG